MTRLENIIKNNRVNIDYEGIAKKFVDGDIEHTITVLNTKNDVMQVLCIINEKYKEHKENFIQQIYNKVI
jgi:hypothetical protein